MSRTETPKTRLEEILPTPEKVSQGGEGRCVRSRVVSHMQKLMMGGVGLYTMGCTGFGVVDPLPDPSRCVDEQGKLAVVEKCGHNVHGQNTLGFLVALNAFLDSLS